MCSFAQLCPTLCNPMDYSLAGSSVHRIFQARILEQVAISYSRRSSQPRDQTCISCIGRWILYHQCTWDTPCQSILTRVNVNDTKPYNHISSYLKRHIQQPFLLLNFLPQQEKLISFTCKEKYYLKSRGGIQA